MKNMSKAARKRLMKSEFWHRIVDIVKAWDCYLAIGDNKSADACMHEWSMAKLALEHITGESYGFTRNGKTYGIVNERDCTDCPILGITTTA